MTAAGRAAAASWRKLQTPIDAADYEVERVMVTSRDGTQLPMFLAHRKGVKRDGKQPALLTGYGGFNHSMTAGLDAVGGPVPRGRRHLRAGHTCAAAASTARTGTAPACSAASRTCSTISSPPPNG